MRHKSLIQQAMEEKRQLERAGLVPQMTREQEYLIRTAGEDAKRLKQAGIPASAFAELAQSREMSKALADIGKIAIPTWAQALPQINQNMAAILRSSPMMDALADATKISGELAKHIATQFEPFEKAFAQKLGPDFAKLSKRLVSSELAAISVNSRLAHDALAAIDMARLGAAFQIPDGIRAAVALVYQDFSSSYRNLLKSFELPETSFYKLPPAISYYPPVELLNSVRLAETSLEAEDQPLSEADAWQQEIAAETH